MVTGTLLLHNVKNDINLFSDEVFLKLVLGFGDVFISHVDNVFNIFFTSFRKSMVEVSE